MESENAIKNKDIIGKLMKNKDNDKIQKVLK